MNIPSVINPGETFTVDENITLVDEVSNLGILTSNATIVNEDVIFNGEFATPFDELGGDGTLINNGAIENNSLIINYDTVDNNNTITSNGNFENNGVLNNNGSFINNFVLDNLSVIRNNGTLTNNNGIRNYSIINNDGIIINNGGFNNEDGVIVNNSGGIIYNEGSISSDSFFSDTDSFIDNGGIVEGSGNFSIPNFTIDSGTFRPEGASLVGDFSLEGSGTLQLFNPDIDPLLTTVDNVSLDSGTLEFGDLSNLAAGAYFLIELVGSSDTLDIDPGLFATAEATVDAFDTDSLDFELVREDNDLLLIVGEDGNEPPAEDPIVTNPLNLVSGGTSGNDGLTGTDNADLIEGLEGNDALEGKRGNDLIDGGGGTDTVVYQFDPASVTVNLEAGTATDGFGDEDTLLAIENVIGSEFDDNLTGDSAVNSLTGRDGDDTISGGDGNDFLVGGAGVDSLTGGSGNDTFLYLNSYFNSGEEESDIISDFAVGNDKIMVLGTSFGGNLLAGTLKASAFFEGVEATTSAHRFGYDSNSGNIIFDRDGVGGDEESIVIATIDAGVGFSNTDITVL